VIQVIIELLTVLERLQVRHLPCSHSTHGDEREPSEFMNFESCSLFFFCPECDAFGMKQPFTRRDRKKMQRFHLPQPRNGEMGGLVESFVDTAVPRLCLPRAL
jgi:hypothetical protein